MIISEILSFKSKTLNYIQAFTWFGFMNGLLSASNGWCEPLLFPLWPLKSGLLR